MEMMEELFAGRWWMGWRAKIDVNAWREGSDELDEKASSKTEVEQVYARNKSIE